ncbi:hypothetical protein HW561_20600 [Rhodobacteraceae bacterium B1Z28]|uniref:Uncharacterized protein n=1 Tax=Ruegeria haliotis TaxID=2747601 RepID=A0ABX2PVI8_9RHOB|nr:hypothetical protein [Ruegeria haliotis]NVO58197.1 hypothetical protein [Ruegeria haliotis]
MPGVEACLRKEPGEHASELAWCDPSNFMGRKLGETAIRWMDGYHLTFRSFDKQWIEVLVEHEEGAKPVFLIGDEKIDNGSVLRIPFYHDYGRTVIPVRGIATIGEVPSATDSLLLQEGRYEIRQELGLLWKYPNVVKQGTFFPGDRVSFAVQPKPGWRRWFGLAQTAGDTSKDVPAQMFIADLDPKDNGVDLVATTELKYSALCLDRVGVIEKRKCLPVSPTERLKEDAFPVALATILGLIGSLVALANAYILPTPRPKS